MADKTIDNFSLVTTLADGDKVPLWQVSSGATKRISVADIVLYLESALDLSGDYLLRDGSVAMLAALDMGGFAITNVGNVDGVDVSALDAAALKKDGSVALTANWDIGVSRKILAERIEARSNLGLMLYEDGGVGIFVQDSTGWVGVNTGSPTRRLTVNGTIRSAGADSGSTYTSSGWTRSIEFPEGGGFVWLKGSGTYSHGIGCTNGGLFYMRSTADDTSAAPIYDLVVTDSGDTGVGIANPDSKLHVWKATAGSVTARANTQLTVESDGANYLSMLAPNGSLQGFVFGNVALPTDCAFIYDDTNAELVFYANNQARIRMKESNNKWEPTSDQGQGLGSASNRWTELYAFTGTINTSDVRTKRNVESSDLGLDFIRALEPIKWVFEDTDIPAIVEKRVEKRQVTQKAVVAETVVEKNGSGKLIRKTVEREIERPVYEEIPLFHPNGKPILESRKVKRIDEETGKEIEVDEQFQAVQQTPLYEEVEFDHVRAEAVKIAHKRPHYGLASQQVKAAMDLLGIEDFAGYIHDPDADFYGLRMDEFIAPLIKAVQQLADRLDQLEQAGIKQ